MRNEKKKMQIKMSCRRDQGLSLSRTKLWYCRIQVCCNAMSLQSVHVCHNHASVLEWRALGGKGVSAYAQIPSLFVTEPVPFSGQNTTKAMQNL